MLPVYPAAWPHAKKQPFVQVVFNSCKALASLYLVKKVGFRYRQAGIAGTAAFDRLERIAGLTSVVRWLRNAHVAKHLGVEKPTQKLRSFFRDGRSNSQSSTTKPRNSRPPHIGRPITKTRSAKRRFRTPSVTRARPPQCNPRARPRSTASSVSQARAQAPQRVVRCGIDVGVGVLCVRRRERR